MEKAFTSSLSLAESITWAASKQTYFTVRFLVDRGRVPDAYRTYAYFRWLDDRLDQEQQERPERIAFVERQKALMEALYRGEMPRDLCEEETMLVQSQAERIKTSLIAGWNANQSFYSYRDRETGLVSTGKEIAHKKGNGNMRPKAEFESGVRLLIEIQTKSPAAKRPEVEISEYFTKSKGETEIILGHQFQWRTGGLVATTQKLFRRVGRVSVTGSVMISSVTQP